MSLNDKRIITNRCFLSIPDEQEKMEYKEFVESFVTKLKTDSKDKWSFAEVLEFELLICSFAFSGCSFCSSW